MIRSHRTSLSRSAPLLAGILLLSAPAPRAAAGQPTAPTQIARSTAGFRIDRVLYDEPGDAALWARGAGYKACFSKESTLYVPCFGSAAPRNFPLALRVAHVSVAGTELGFDAQASPVRTGDRVSYDRSAFVERYDVALDALEQSFVFDELPVRGEIVVRIAATSELARRATSEALEFSNELGTVRYGRATVIDAAGVSAPAATTLTDEGIEIRVAASFVEHAQLPLTIDPLVTTFLVNGNLSSSSMLSDVAYDATTASYLCVFESEASATDHDVFFTILSGAGDVVHFDALDFTSENWTHPHVANNRYSHQFLAIVEVGSEGGGARQIRGLTIDSPTGAKSGLIAVSGTDAGDNEHASVGGDPSGSPQSCYAVVWENDLAGASDIKARLVTTNGALVGAGTICIDCSAAIDAKPSISKSNMGANWNIAWQREVFAKHDIAGCQLQADGVISAPTFMIDVSTADDTEPSATSSIGTYGPWLVAFQRQNAGHHDIVAWVVSGSTPTSYAYLSAEENLNGSGTLNEDQIHPSADCDGRAFVVAYAESVNSSVSNRDIYAMTVGLVGSQPRVAESHQLMVGTPPFQDYPAITSCGESGGPQQRFMLSWMNGSQAAGEPTGALYDASPFTSFCVPGFDAVACPCGNPSSAFGRGCNNSSSTGGAQLSAAGVPSLANDSVQLTSNGEKPTALSIFGQGNAIVASGTPFGQGVRCAGGALKRLYTKTAFGGSVSAPSSGDPSISLRSAAVGDPIAPGSARYYYVYYRDPIVLGGCPAASTFNSTQTVQTRWSL
jgi:hypothetical protein